MSRIIMNDLKSLKTHLNHTLSNNYGIMYTRPSMNYSYYKTFRFVLAPYENLKDSYFYLILKKEYSMPVYEAILTNINTFESKNILFNYYWIICSNLNRNKPATVLSINDVFEKLSSVLVYYPKKINLQISLNSINIERIRSKKKNYRTSNVKNNLSVIANIENNISTKLRNHQYRYYKSNILNSFKSKYQLLKKNSNSFLKMLTFYEYINNIKKQSFLKAIDNYRWITLKWFSSKYKEYVVGLNTYSNTYIHDSLKLSNLETNYNSISLFNNRIDSIYIYLEILNIFGCYSEYSSLNVPSKYVNSKEASIYVNYLKTLTVNTTNIHKNKVITSWSPFAAHFKENIHYYKHSILNKWVLKKKVSHDITHINELLTCFFIEKKNNLYMMKLLKDNILGICNTFFFRRHYKTIKYNSNINAKWKVTNKNSMNENPLISEMLFNKNTTSNTFYAKYLIASQKSIIYKRPKIKKRKNKLQFLRKSDLDRIFGSKKVKAGKKWALNKLKPNHLRQSLNIRKHYLLQSKKLSNLEYYSMGKIKNLNTNNLFRSMKNTEEWKKNLFVKWLKLKKYTPWNKFYKFFRWKKKKDLYKITPLTVLERQKNIINKKKLNEYLISNVVINTSNYNNINNWFRNKKLKHKYRFLSLLKKTWYLNRKRLLKSKSNRLKVNSIRKKKKMSWWRGRMSDFIWNRKRYRNLNKKKKLLSLTKLKGQIGYLLKKKINIYKKKNTTIISGKVQKHLMHNKNKLRTLKKQRCDIKNISEYKNDYRWFLYFTQQDYHLKTFINFLIKKGKKTKAISIFCNTLKALKNVSLMSPLVLLKSLFASNHNYYLYKSITMKKKNLYKITLFNWKKRINTSYHAFFKELKELHLTDYLSISDKIVYLILLYADTVSYSEENDTNGSIVFEKRFFLNKQHSKVKNKSIYKYNSKIRNADVLMNYKKKI